MSQSPEQETLVMSISVADYLRLLERIERLRLALRIYAGMDYRPTLAAQALAEDDRLGSPGTDLAKARELAQNEER